VLRYPDPPVNCTSPMLVTAKRDSPDFEALIMSPVPELSIRIAAEMVLAEIDAAGRLPKDPLTSRVVYGVELKPMPTLFDPVGERMMSPEVAPPIVRFCELVVPRFPSPVRNEVLLPVLSAMLNVGVPPATFINANLADEVAFDPSRRSWFPILSKMAPLPDSNGDPP